MIEETIRNGMLTALQETFATAPQTNMSPKGSKSIGGGMSGRKDRNAKVGIPASTLSAMG